MVSEQDEGLEETKAGGEVLFQGEELFSESRPPHRVLTQKHAHRIREATSPEVIVKKHLRKHWITFEQLFKTFDNLLACLYNRRYEVMGVVQPSL